MLLAQGVLQIEVIPVEGLRLALAPARPDLDPILQRPECLNSLEDVLAGHGRLIEALGDLVALVAVRVGR